MDPPHCRSSSIRKLCVIGWPVINYRRNNLLYYSMGLRVWGLGRGFAKSGIGRTPVTPLVSGQRIMYPVFQVRSLEGKAFPVCRVRERVLPVPNPRRAQGVALPRGEHFRLFPPPLPAWRNVTSAISVRCQQSDVYIIINNNNNSF